jgi:hypothetical protein
LVPTAAERLVWGRGAGDGLKVVNTEIGKVGGLIWYVRVLTVYGALQIKLTEHSWENYMPAARLALYQQGIE